jgi:hypothetical protein
VSIVIGRHSQPFHPCAESERNFEKEARMSQHQISIAVAVVVVVAAIAVVAFLITKKRRSQALRERFGPEYDRVVRQEGNTSRGEEVLEFRAKRRDKFDIKPLSPSAQAEFASRWSNLQPQFVDDPKGSVTRADELVTEIMRARGYPMGDFEQRAADISVDHPVVVDNYRTAHNIALRHNAGQATTEDLRKAMVHYRALFEDLLGTPQSDSLPLRKEARG